MNINRSLTMRHIVIGMKSERKEKKKHQEKVGRKEEKMTYNRNK